MDVSPSRIQLEFDRTESSVQRSAERPNSKFFNSPIRRGGLALAEGAARLRLQTGRGAKPQSLTFGKIRTCCATR
jgi:hypothetical protein